MKGFQFGLKLWSTNVDKINQINNIIKNDLFQYIELTLIPESNIEPFLKLNVPYIAHLATEKQGFRIADRNKRDFNHKVLDWSLKCADELPARYIILHPDSGRMEDALDFLKEVNDQRILIENMPKVGINGEKMIGYDADQIKQLMGQRFGFCLDLNHAIKASISLDIPYAEFIRELVGLGPSMFHIADGRMGWERDEHMNFGEGEYDLGAILNLLGGHETKPITLETPRSSFEDDLKNLKILKEHII